MPKRVAITIAGAVSLGSYEAGVLFEVLHAIRLNNEDAGSDEGKKIYIDVISGASAGAMTAAMVAQALLYNGGCLDDPFKNPLYQAWVEEINLLGLAKMGIHEKKWYSLLSSNLVEKIGHERLIDSIRHASMKAHPAIERPHGEKDDTVLLRLGMALTNLNGIDYMIPIVGVNGGGFNYTTSMDQKLFDLTRKGPANNVTWEQICTSAIASGAFPLAFRPVEIEHKTSEYGAELPKPVGADDYGQTFVDWTTREKAATRRFANSDGGVLQNQPLGIAKNLVDNSVADRIDRGDPDADCDSADRLYIFVAPHSVKSSAENLQASKISIWGEMKALGGVYRRQATFHDWINAEGINQEINLLDRRATQLAKTIEDGAVDVLTIQKAAAELNALLIPEGYVKRLDRLKAQYSQEYGKLLEKGETAARAFVEAIATLEAAAQLHDRDKMKICAVIPDREQLLMGAGLAAFVGFFNKKFRMYDYWMGRKLAKSYLKQSDVKRILGVEKWPENAGLDIELPNPTQLKPPPGAFALFRSGCIPFLFMVGVRPILWIIPVLITLGIWILLHNCHCRFR